MVASTGPRVVVVQKCRQLLSQRLVPFGLMPGNDSSLKQEFLDVARQRAPRRDHGLPQCARKAFVVHPVSMQSTRTGSDWGASSVI